MDRKYVFMIRPTADSPSVLPKEWRLRGAFGPLAILEASKAGLRIIQRSTQAFAAQILVGSALGIAAMLGVFAPTAFLIISGLGLTIGSAIVGCSVAGLVTIGVTLLLSPCVRKLAAWRPLERLVQIRVLSASLGMFHQELRIEGDGHDVLVRTNARWATITAALRLAHRMPPELEPVSGTRTR